MASVFLHEPTMERLTDRSLNMSELANLRPRAVLALFGLMALGLSAPAALAASAPAPVGVWESDSGEHLVVGETCGIEANGVQGAVGSCSWDPDGQGGILTIINVNAYQPAPVYFNVVWLDQSTISVSGSRFHRKS